MNAVMQGLSNTRTVTRTIVLVGAEVSQRAMLYAGCALTGAVVIGAGHLRRTACRGLGEGGIPVPAATLRSAWSPSADNAA